uniref:Predicted nuclease of the RNAse H fold, HicB family n=1 Tax=Candidatus Kentrum sp. MB TaxID=2138164 RepID=A0A451BAI5_9GAMM|nr:MAG: Predicted nuclease of the RNAse H fold, HicB family [Candidatus Kentron sp. MB]VFK30547.1 MAG: Predicted nuclease of the RNAse H fold, HicB family [Candidatus Kentron sp. MB]VFK75293.1 MAG: Predicted nuclease of the RNAse H fold, HicB family [Candidatus Kentron sp. MB]
MKYLIVVEETNTGFSAYLPDIDGCVATGKTRQEVHDNMKEALAFHLEGLQIGEQTIPAPHTYSDYIELPMMALG